MRSACIEKVFLFWVECCFYHIKINYKSVSSINDNILNLACCNYNINIEKCKYTFHSLFTCNLTIIDMENGFQYSHFERSGEDESK